MSNWGLVDATTSVDVYRVDDLVSRLCVPLTLMLVLILARWSQEKTTIRRKGETSEKGRQGLVGVEIGVLHTQARADLRLW